jgi:hypothetical protein
MKLKIKKTRVLSNEIEDKKTKSRLVRNINLGEKKMVGVFDMSYHHGKSNRLYS